MENIKIYEINAAYINYLVPYAPHLFHNRQQGQANERKYIGIVLQVNGLDYFAPLATVYKGNIIKNLIMDCQSYTKYRPNETTGGIFVSWRRKEELPTGA